MSDMRVTEPSRLTPRFRGRGTKILRGGGCEARQWVAGLLPYAECAWSSEDKVWVAIETPQYWRHQEPGTPVKERYSHQSSLPRLPMLQGAASGRQGPHKSTRAKMVTQKTSGTRQETWNICSAVVWFSVGALCLYCIPFFLLEFRVSFCDVLYWKCVMIWVVFVVLSTYFVFFSIFLIVQKKHWTVRFFNLSCKVHGSFWSWIGGTLHSELTVRL